MTGAWPPPPPPKLEVVGYELEVHPYGGLWSRFEGRIITLVQSPGAAEPYRMHYSPDHGPTSNGRTFVTTQPYWARARTRKRLEAKLLNMLNKRLKQQRDARPERVPLEDTMAGWQ